MITVLCGLQDEASIFKGAGDLQVLCGATQRDLFASLTSKSCKALVRVGCVGGLAPDLKLGALTVATSLIMLDGTTYQPDLPWLKVLAAKLPTADFRRFFSCPTEQCATAAQRAALRAKFRVDISEEEGWAVAELATQRSLPWIDFGGVSDTYDQTILPDDAKAIRPDGSEDVGAIIGDVFGNLPEAIREGVGFEIDALGSIRDAFKALGPDFGFGARS